MVFVVCVAGYSSGGILERESKDRKPEGLCRKSSHKRSIGGLPEQITIHSFKNSCKDVHCCRRTLTIPRPAPIIFGDKFVIFVALFS